MRSKGRMFAISQPTADLLVCRCRRPNAYADFVPPGGDPVSPVYPKPIVGDTSNKYDGMSIITLVTFEMWL